jgi:adenylate kinase family enzyme
MEQMNHKRVVVLGTSGSGKTTLARKIAARYNIKHIELDLLYWNAGWKPTPMPDFLQKINKAVQENESWVICGNYNEAKQITLPRATDIVWLNYPLRINLWQALKRSVKRIFTKEESFPGCPETRAHLLL